MKYRLCFFLGLALVGQGCGGGDDSSGAGTGGADPTGGSSGGASDASVGPSHPCSGDMAGVQAIFTDRCALGGCHSPPAAAAALDLSEASSEGALVGTEAALCDNIERVAPGDPDGSLLYLKITGAPPTDCGESMPPVGAPLDAEQIACIAAWITGLSTDTGTDASTDPGCQTCGEPDCVDTQTDARHCGDCGLACPAGATCGGGQCECLGELLLCGTACVDTQTNVLHCGGCDSPCSGPATCVAGQCECAPGFDKCGNACVDTNEDPDNCGGCGTVCTAGQSCLSGSCQTGSCLPLTKCGRACVDTDTSFFNCGGCDSSCDAGEACGGGICGCGPGTSLCNGACIVTDSDPANCGGCGVACDAGELCANGSCQCPGGGTACGGACIDTSEDPNNCGGCNVRCSIGQTCSAGACVCDTSSSATFAEVSAILTANCAVAGCHSGARPREGLSLESGDIVAGLVDVKAAQCSDGRKRVAPGAPQASYLMDKLLGQNLCGGSQMPKAGASLPAKDLQAISAWICAGAPSP